jgi:hypothetical protein
MEKDEGRLKEIDAAEERARLKAARTRSSNQEAAASFKQLTSSC